MTAAHAARHSGPSGESSPRERPAGWPSILSGAANAQLLSSWAAPAIVESLPSPFKTAENQFYSGGATFFAPQSPPACPGDLTGDGVTDSADLNEVLGGFGAAYDSTDLNVVLAGFGCDG